MNFLCPECDRPDLNLQHGLELPGDAKWDEISIQIVSCPGCRFVGVATYSESRRGRLDAECSEHWGYRIDLAEAIRLKAEFLLCPKPEKRSCDCPTHRSLGRRDSQERWIGLTELELGKPFAIQRA